MSSANHSAVVRITLHVNGQEIRVAQMGPDFLTLKEPAQLPPSHGQVTLEVDGNVQTFEVSFPDGISAKDKRVTVADPDEF